MSKLIQRLKLEYGFYYHEYLHKNKSIIYNVEDYNFKKELMTNNLKYLVFFNTIALYIKFLIRNKSLSKSLYCKIEIYNLMH